MNGDDFSQDPMPGVASALNRARVSRVLAATAVGQMALGASAFVEARFRRIRPPPDLDI